MIYTASVYGLLRTILILLLIYFGIKILARLFAPILLKFVAKKASERFGQQFGQQTQQPRKNHKDGETIIDKMPQRNTTSNKDVGEYIDFEEIE